MLKFIDLFSGIGGFHMALHALDMKCVFAAEWDRYARKTYQENFKGISPDLFKHGRFAGDINKVDIEKIPDFDILCAGFPCQPFSQAGLKKGFDEARGTLFFTIVDIIKKKQPRAFLLENVRYLINHNNGHTFATIKKRIGNIGYSFHYKIIKASDFGLPQHRPRLFIVGFKQPHAFQFEFPKPIARTMTMSDVFNGNCEKKIGYTLRVGGKGSPIDDRRNWDGYVVDGKVCRLSPKEALKMQGFPNNYVFPVSNAQAMKQLGNTVAIPVVKAVAHEIKKCLQTV